MIAQSFFFWRWRGSQPIISQALKLARQESQKDHLEFYRLALIRTRTSSAKRFMQEKFNPDGATDTTQLLASSLAMELISAHRWPEALTILQEHPQALLLKRVSAGWQDMLVGITHHHPAFVALLTGEKGAWESCVRLALTLPEGVRWMHEHLTDIFHFLARHESLMRKRLREETEHTAVFKKLRTQRIIEGIENAYQCLEILLDDYAPWLGVVSADERCHQLMHAEQMSRLMNKSFFKSCLEREDFLVQFVFERLQDQVGLGPKEESQLKEAFKHARSRGLVTKTFTLADMNQTNKGGLPKQNALDFALGRARNVHENWMRNFFKQWVEHDGELPRTVDLPGGSTISMEDYLRWMRAEYLISPYREARFLRDMKKPPEKAMRKV